MNRARSSPSLDALAKSARRRRRQRRTASSPESLPIATAVCENKGAMPKSSARVLGPYANGDKWRLVLLDGSSRKALVADSHEAALKLRDDLQGQINTHVSRTIGETLDEYLTEMAHRGLQAATIKQFSQRLPAFLPIDKPLAFISAERAEEMYLQESRRLRANGQPLAADSHRLMLRRAKHFYSWAVSRRYIDRNPFNDVKPVGRPRRGKLQLRIDEARRFVTLALERANKFDIGATAALMQVFLGLRPTEALIRAVRDLDDDGNVLWVPFGKTSNARRRLQVPDPLRQVLLKHARGKAADAPLLGPPGEKSHTRHVLHYRVKMLCRDASVPRICPHSLRGLNATLALEAGATAHQVAAALGHASFTTTARHYADASTVRNASLRKVADVLNNKGVQPLNMQHLANLLRENLDPEQLLLLREQLVN